MLTRNRVAASTLALSLAMTPLLAPAQAIAAPSAKQCSTEVVSGSADWGIRASFLEYVQNTGFANGKIETSNGATFKDGTLLYDLDPAHSNIESATKGTVALKGNVHITAHHGVLDMNLSNLKIKVDGNTGTLLADWSSAQTGNFDPNKSHEKGEVKSGTQTPIAALKFTNAPDLTNKNLKLNATSTATAEAKQLYQNYKAGAELAPLTVTGTTKQSCENGQPTTKPDPNEKPITKPTEGSTKDAFGVFAAIAALGAVIAGLYAWAVNAGLVPRIR